MIMSYRYLIHRTALSKLANEWISQKTASGIINLNSARCFSVTSSKNMKILQFTRTAECPCEVRVGYLVDEKRVVDINRVDPSLPQTLLQILQKNKLEQVLNLPSTKPASIPLEDVRIMAPITGMDKVLCVGLNYKDHCQEQNLEPPAVPMIFNKFPSTIVGPTEPVRLRTDVTQKVDYEVELVVVIGKTASSVKAADAFNYIMGYTIAQDISARDWQKEKNNGQFLLGKSMDGFCPIGPWITTSDEIGNPENLKISCSLNGVEKQSSRTDQLVHKIPQLIERISSVLTLLPGDIILTGTPGGVGMYRSPPEYLQPGDVLISEIEKIGALECKFVQN